MHTGVIIGFFSLLMMLAGDALERTGWYVFQPRLPAIEGQPQPPKFYLHIIAVGVLASLINPYGYEIYA